MSDTMTIPRQADAQPPHHEASRCLLERGNAITGDWKNTLYYGDNLDVLRRHLKDETVDLVYLDPPFNSNATYNVLFAEQDGTRAAAQISNQARCRVACS